MDAIAAYGKNISNNPLKNRQDLQAAFLQLTEPLKEHYSKGCAYLQLGAAGAGYSAQIAEMEGFSRVLWGMIPFLAGGGETSLWEMCLEGIRNGTNPEHEEYWGAVNDYDQRLVEMAVFGYALACIPERIWQPLNVQEKHNLHIWLDQINHHPCYDCNWLFFHVFVNIGFRKVGLPYDQEQLERNLNRIDEFYLGEGWYSDGPGGHSDYYVPFALHYYGLLYAKLMKKEDPERADRFKERAAKFAVEFLQWFSPDGSALPYGRSLTYRFAQSAFWCALAYAEVQVLSPGIIKGLVLRNLRWWFGQPIFDSGDILTIGYAYPNLIMAETYNSPGSPYWAFKTFLPLAFSENHPFWQAEEEALPATPSMTVQSAPHLVICRQEKTGHVAAFNSGHPTSNEHTHTSAKYEKFVYSTAFGFSVPRAEWGLGQGAFDSMLALSEGDNLYRVRRKNEETCIEKDIIYARWMPWMNVCVQTWIVTGLPWHLRIHLVTTERELDAAEGGFALGLGREQETVHVLPESGAAVINAFGASAVLGKYGYSQAELIYPNANTNVLHPRTAIPTLRAHLQSGSHLLISAVYGEPAFDKNSFHNSCSIESSLRDPFGLIEVSAGKVRIIPPSGEAIIIDLMNDSNL